MILPQLKRLRTKADRTEDYGGYDHRPRTEENTFYEMTNASGDWYPAIGPRLPRGERAMPKKAQRVQALLKGEHLTYIADNWLYVKDKRVMELGPDEPKQIIAMGAYLIVFPDKKYYNTADPKDTGDMEATFGAENGIKYQLCDTDGKSYDTPVVSDTEPTNPTNGMLWLDTSETPNALKQFNAVTGLWAGVASIHMALRYPGIGKGFKAGDAVKVTGIRQIDESVANLEGTNVLLTYADDGMIVMPGLVRQAGTTTQFFGIERAVPILDHVFECGNRLWGCRYGEDADGNFVNEIYCSKLGDFKNWRCYAGISTDSYAVTVGSDGAFTGGIAYRGYPCFFKENELHRIYGAYPAAFQLNSMTCRGVQEGAAESMVILNERLFYKSRGCICVFDGSYPNEISGALGDISYDAPGENGQPSAAAGAADNKYYISMRSARDGLYHLFQFDTERGAWFREDNTRAFQFATERGRLFYIDGSTARVTGVTARAGDASIEGPFEWSLTTGVIGMAQAEHKYISRLSMRVTLTPGSRMRIYVQYDSTGEYKMITDLRGNALRTISVPVRPQRCDHFRLRYVCVGDVKLHSMIKTIEGGTDL